VVLPEAAAVCAVDVRGGAPGTRETDALDPGGLIEVVDAVVLSGGSAYGLDAAGGVMAWLAARGQGFRVGDASIPIVPVAILFDLHNGSDKAWDDLPPYRELGRRACAAAAREFTLGNAGAGLGATAGLLKGGLGSASFVLERGDGEPLTIGALAAVNALGAVTMPDSPVFWAWPFEQAGEFGGRSPREVPIPLPLEVELESAFATNTTLVVVATDAALSKTQAGRLAVMAGRHRARDPAGTHPARRRYRVRARDRPAAACAAHPWT
jgi:L-aminopeptidase/D-esterase-like protein